MVPDSTAECFIHSGGWPLGRRFSKFRKRQSLRPSLAKLLQKIFGRTGCLETGTSGGRILSSGLLPGNEGGREIGRP